MKVKLFSPRDLAKGASQIAENTELTFIGITDIRSCSLSDYTYHFYGINRYCGRVTSTGMINNCQHPAVSSDEDNS